MSRSGTGLDLVVAVECDALVVVVDDVVVDAVAAEVGHVDGVVVQRHLVGVSDVLPRNEGRLWL